MGSGRWYRPREAIDLVVNLHCGIRTIEITTARTRADASRTRPRSSVGEVDGAAEAVGGLVGIGGIEVGLAVVGPAAPVRRPAGEGFAVGFADLGERRWPGPQQTVRHGVAEHCLDRHCRVNPRLPASVTRARRRSCRCRRAVGLATGSPTPTAGCVWKVQTYKRRLSSVSSKSMNGEAVAPQPFTSAAPTTERGTCLVRSDVPQCRSRKRARGCLPLPFDDPTQTARFCDYPLKKPASTKAGSNAAHQSDTAH